MRWIFLDPLNPQEAAYRAETLRRINAWWSEFAGKTGDLDKLFKNQSSWDLPAWMEENLQAINAGLMWEFGPAVHGEGHRLVITPESQHFLRPLVQTILDRAPEIGGWEFYDCRLPESEEMTVQTVQARTGGDIAGARAWAEIGPSGKIDLLFCLPNCTEPDDEEQFHHAFVAAETLLGETTLDRWIGAIEAEPFPKNRLLWGVLKRPKRRVDPARLLPLDQLRPTVEQLIAQQVQKLPEKPCHEWVADAMWSSYELSPEPADDYPRRADMFVAITARGEVFESQAGSGLFHSSRFSRCGETFCYVKLDRSAAADDGEKYLDREPLEDALNARLGAAKLGCVIGGGTGIRYSYSDLALTDLQRGVAAVRETLREREVPLRTWIQFFDDELAAEWVGVHSDAPPPPEFAD